MTLWFDKFLWYQICENRKPTKTRHVAFWIVLKVADQSAYQRQVSVKKLLININIKISILIKLIIAKSNSWKSVINFNRFVFIIIVMHYLECWISAVHRGAFCQFPFRWIYYYGNNKSTGKETGKMHLCVVCTIVCTTALSKNQVDLKMIAIQVNRGVHKNCFMVITMYCSW